MGGDAEAETEGFLGLVRRFGPALRAVLSRMAGAAAAVDLLQEAFLRAWRERATYRPERGATSTWLYRIALNAARDHLRRGRVRDAARERERARAAAAGEAAPGPEGAVERREEDERVRAAVDTLPEAERAVVLLHVNAALSFREAAEVLQVPVTTAKNRFAAALRRLRECLEVNAWAKE